MLNRTKKLSAILFLGVLATANAQVVIEQSDFPVAGDIINFGTDIDVSNLSLNVGNTGAGQTFDFSMLQTDSLFDVGFYAPGSVTGGADFTSADMAVDQSGAYAFAVVGTGEVSVIGLGGDFGPQLGLPSEFVISIPAINPWTIFTFPSQLGTSFIDTAVFDQKLDSDGLIPANLTQLWDPDSVRIKRTIYMESVMDAEGTLTNVLAETHDVLRMNVVETGIDTIWGWTAADGWERPPELAELFLSLPSFEVTYRLRYISKELGYYVAEILTDSLGVPLSATFVSDSSQCCTGVEEIIAAGGNVLYPNPASDYVRVRTGGDIYRLQIMDMSGKLLLSTPLTYDGQTVQLDGLADGLYIYRMLTEDGQTAYTGRLSRIR